MDPTRTHGPHGMTVKELSIHPFSLCNWMDGKHREYQREIREIKEIRDFFFETLPNFLNFLKFPNPLLIIYDTI